MKGILLILILTVPLPIASFGQKTNAANTVCTDQTAQKISSRGITLGMKLSDVLNLLPLSNEDKQAARSSVAKQSHYGFSAYDFYPTRNDTKFEGIRSYNFRFFDEQLVSLGITYDQPKWKDVNEFGETIIKTFNLPKIENWRTLEQRRREMAEKRMGGIEPPIRGELSLQCENHFILLVAPYGYEGTEQPPEIMRLTVSDNRYIKVMLERERKAYEEKKVFKP